MFFHLKSLRRINSFSPLLCKCAEFSCSLSLFECCICTYYVYSFMSNHQIWPSNQSREALVSRDWLPDPPSGSGSIGLLLWKALSMCSYHMIAWSHGRFLWNFMVSRYWLTLNLLFWASSIQGSIMKGTRFGSLSNAHTVWLTATRFDMAVHLG